MCLMVHKGVERVVVYYLKKVTLVFILLLEEAQPKFNIDLVPAFSPECHTRTKTKTNMCGLFPLRKKY